MTQQDNDKNNNNNNNDQDHLLFQGNLWTGIKQAKRQQEQQQQQSQKEETIVSMSKENNDDDDAEDDGTKTRNKDKSQKEAEEPLPSSRISQQQQQQQQQNQRPFSASKSPPLTNQTKQTSVRTHRPKSSSSSTKTTSLSPCKTRRVLQTFSSSSSSPGKESSSSSLSPLRNRNTSPRPFSSQQQHRTREKKISTTTNTSPKRGSIATMPSRTKNEQNSSTTGSSNTVISPLKKSRHAVMDNDKVEENNNNTHQESNNKKQDDKSKETHNHDDYKKQDNKDMDQQLKIEQMKNDRRRKSVNVLRNSAQSDQIRQMFDMSLYENITTMAATSNGITGGVAEERLKNILTKAKESGMTADDIFSFFNGGNPNTTKITKDSFLASLEKLGGTFLNMSDDELTDIVKKFDMNEDGKISIVEFKNYCYFQIPSIAWKAERTRLEKSGEMKMLQAQLSRRFKPGQWLDGNACGEEVYRTSKFFWKTNNNVEIRMFYNERLNVISMQLYSQASERELPSIYVCKNKVDHQHTRLKDDVTKALQKIEGRTDDQELTRRNAMWDSIAKYLVERLKIWERGTPGEISSESEECSHISKEEQYVPYLCKLPGT